MRVRVTMYSSRECHLCDAARDVVGSVRESRPFEFDIVTIDDDPDLEARFRPEIPVVHVNGQFAFRYRVDPVELRRRIEQAEQQDQ